MTSFFDKFNEELKSSHRGEDFLFLYLNYSIINGEYLLDDEITSKIKNILTELILNDDSNGNEIIKYLYYYNNFSEKILNNLNSLLEDGFENILDVKLNFKNKLLEIFIDKKDENDIIKHLKSLFIINLNLAELDEHLESDKWCLEELDSINDYLIDNKILYQDKFVSRIYKILSDKCKYLIFKIHYRRDDFRKLNINEVLVNGENEIIINNDKVAIKNNNKLYIDKDNYYFIFYKKTIEHYHRRSDGKFCERLKNIFANFNIDNLSSYKISELYEYNKFLKNDSTQSQEKKDENFTKIIDFLKEQNLSDSFDNLANKSAINFFNNARIKVFLPSDKKNNDNTKFSNIIDESFYNSSESITLKKFIEKINVFLNDKKDVKYIDFKRFEIVLDFLDDLFEYLISNSLVIFPVKKLPEISSITELDIYYNNSLSNIKLLEEFYQDILKKFEEKNNSESDQGLMPIYLEKTSCIETKEISIPTNNDSEIEKVELNLFLDSSYILPVNFEEINEKIKKESLVYKYDLKLIKGNISSIYNLNKSISIYKDTENKFKENEFKTVQIVAMFVTIATFVLLNVKIFDNKTGRESIALLSAIAGIFILFNSFFNWLIQGQVNNKPTKINHVLILFPILLIGSSFFALYNFDLNKFSPKEIKFIETKIDSLSSVKVSQYKEKRIKDSTELKAIKAKYEK